MQCALRSEKIVPCHSRRDVGESMCAWTQDFAVRCFEVVQRHNCHGVGIDMRGLSFQGGFQDGSGRNQRTLMEFMEERSRSSPNHFFARGDVTK